MDIKHRSDIFMDPIFLSFPDPLCYWRLNLIRRKNEVASIKWTER